MPLLSALLVAKEYQVLPTWMMDGSGKLDEMTGPFTTRFSRGRAVTSEVIDSSAVAPRAGRNGSMVRVCAMGGWSSQRIMSQEGRQIYTRSAREY